MEETYEIPGEFVQKHRLTDTFANTDPALDWACLRCPNPANISYSPEMVILWGNGETLDDPGSPTFLGLRQRGFVFDLGVDVSLSGCGGEGGISVYMCETEHYDIALRWTPRGREAVLKLNIGEIRHEAAVVPLSEGPVRLQVRADPQTYRFYVSQKGGEIFLGQGKAKYLSSEVAGGFTGVMLALYAVGEGTSAAFAHFLLEYPAP